MGAQRCGKILSFLVLLMSFVLHASAYQVLVSDQDEVRQVCSGMYGKGKEPPFIEVLFAPSSRGQLALVIFEWRDAKYLGVDKSGGSSENSWAEDRMYICTVDALDLKLCTEEDLGRFITTPAKLPEDVSIFTTAVKFDADHGPFRYDVKKTGYYCVGTVPVVMESSTSNSSFTGVVDFENVFGGHLPAGEYPKVWFYFSLTMAYIVVGAVWAFLCFRNRGQLLPIQHYISATILFLIVEIFMMYTYYNYLNTTGSTGVSKLLLFIVAVLNAGRNSLSFFMLLITSMGYGVVRPSLGPIMLKARALAAVHFVFGVLYSLGTVTIPLESAGFFVFFFIFPLSFSLTAFLMWIMWSLNSTIADLSARRQLYKKTMFTRLYRILLFAVITIGAFFIISSLSFSSRLDPDFGPKTWKTRWILLDGWLGMLYFLVFLAIAFLWRPTDRNRMLSMSEEVPTDEAGAEEYEVGSLRKDLGGETSDERDAEVVFDVGEDETDEEEDGGGKDSRRGSYESGRRDSGAGQDMGLVGGGHKRRTSTAHRREDSYGESDDGIPPPSYRDMRRD